MSAFTVRAELPDSSYQDFTVTAEDFCAMDGRVIERAWQVAKLRAADRIKAEHGPECRIEWRGLVAFVDRDVPCGEKRAGDRFVLKTLKRVAPSAP